MLITDKMTKMEQLQDDSHLRLKWSTILFKIAHEKYRFRCSTYVTSASEHLTITIQLPYSNRESILLSILVHYVNILIIQSNRITYIEVIVSELTVSNATLNITTSLSSESLLHSSTVLPVNCKVKRKIISENKK